MGKCLLGVRVSKEWNKAEGRVRQTVKILINAAHRAMFQVRDGGCSFPVWSWKRGGLHPGH